MNPPFILFPNVVLLAQIDEIGYRFSSEELKTVDDINLIKLVSTWALAKQSNERNEAKESDSKFISKEYGALLPPQRAGLKSSLKLFVIIICSSLCGKW